MGYAIEFEGSAEEIGKKFDETREQCASYGMIEPEQRDIDELRDLAMQFAQEYGRVKVSASGHWNTATGVAPSEGNPGGTVNSFARASITITVAPTPVE